MGVCSSSTNKPSDGLNTVKRKSWVRYILGNPPRRAMADCERYRNFYPDIVEPPNSDKLKKNESFFLNLIPSTPKGAFIDVIHKEWWHDYKKLEVHHSYIQWIFPLREPGLNPEQHPLTLREIESIKSNPECIKRLLKSYDMMLNFYGQRRVDEAGTIARTNEWKERYRNLTEHPHNFLRITRILKCLGEFGCEYLKKPWIDFLIVDVFEEDCPLKDMCESLVNYCIGVLRDAEERKDCQRQVERFAGDFPIL